MAATFTVSDGVRAILERATVDRMYDGTFTLKLHEGQLDRKLYLAVDKVLAGAGGSWERKFGWHRFPGDPRPALLGAVETGTATNEKQALGKFYTPPDVATLLVDRALDLHAGKFGHGTDTLRVLEPSVGGGALLRAILARLPRAFVTCFDVDQLAVSKIEAEQDPRVEVTCQDFLEVDLAPQFDLVVMNPPFSRGLDAKHVLNALEHLKPGGVLAAITTPNVVSGSGKPRAALRAALAACSTCEESMLPAESFRSEGTSVRTQILLVRK